MTDERRGRYAAAIEAKLRDTAHALCYDPQDAAADAAMAVADAERAEIVKMLHGKCMRLHDENARLRTELEQLRTRARRPSAPSDT